MPVTHHEVETMDTQPKPGISVDLPASEELDAICYYSELTIHSIDPIIVPA